MNSSSGSPSSLSPRPIRPISMSSFSASNSLQRICKSRSKVSILTRTRHNRWESRITLATRRTNLVKEGPSRLDTMLSKGYHPWDSRNETGKKKLLKWLKLRRTYVKFEATKNPFIELVFQREKNQRNILSLHFQRKIWKSENIVSLRLEKAFSHPK